MPKLRLSTAGRRGGLWLAAGVATAVVAVPGVASADGADPGPVVPPASVPGPVGDALDQLAGQTRQGDGGQTPAGESQQQSAQQDTTTPGTPAPPGLPPQLQRFLDGLQPSPECSAAIQADLTKLLTDVPNLVQAVIDQLTRQLGSGSPPDPQRILDQLQGLLGQSQGQAGADTSTQGPDPTVILTDLQQLVTDLTTTCAPAPPTTTPPAPSPPSSPRQPPAQGVSRPPQAQPVSYPGYAPTGGIAPARRPASDASGPVPLSVLGGVVLASTATAAARSRARRGGR